MTATIELRAFMDLRAFFRARGWPHPHAFPLEEETTGPALLARIGVDRAAVESLFVNRHAVAVEAAVIRPGDRVALVPPGVPGPHRLLLGIHDKKTVRRPADDEAPADEEAEEAVPT